MNHECLVKTNKTGHKNITDGKSLKFFEFFIPLMDIVWVSYGCFMYVYVLCHWCVLRKAHKHIIRDPQFRPTFHDS